MNGGDSDKLRVEHANGVCTLTLNRPARLNAIDRALMGTLLAALRTAEADPAVRVIVLAGAGRAFCAGKDLKAHAHEAADTAGARAEVDLVQDVSRAIVFATKPVIASVQGWAAGGGLEWMIGCDLAILAENARCVFPETALGLTVTGGVSTLLPAAVGRVRAMGLVLTGEPFDARTALALGLAWKVVPDAHLVAETAALAATVAALPAETVTRVKRMMNADLRAQIEAALVRESEAALAAVADPDTNARIARFARASQKGIPRRSG